MMKINIKAGKGFSLVELMVAMVVGLIIMSGVFAMNAATRDAQKTSVAQMDMVADARFAIQLISYDLRHAGMWGGTNVGALISCRAGDACSASISGEAIPSDVTVGNDCGGGDWYINLSQPVFASDNTNPYSGSCIPNAEGYVDGTDVLDIHYADSNEPGALLDDTVYVRANILNGRLFISATEPTLDLYGSSAFTGNHELYAYSYYISDFTDSPGDGIPSLRRAALIKGPSVQNQLLVSGVAAMQVQFGEDVDGDQVADRYVNPDDVTNWNEVYAAKIWLVMQTDEELENIDTTKTFNIAGVDTKFGGVDKPRFFMVTSVISLRNLKQL